MRKEMLIRNGSARQFDQDARRKPGDGNEQSQGDCSVVISSLINEPLHFGGIQKNTLPQLLGWFTIANSAEVENL